MKTIGHLFALAYLASTMIIRNSDPYGQRSLVPALPWGPDARARKQKKP